MHPFGVSITKKIPLLRPLVGLITGIILQWYLHLPFYICLVALAIVLILTLINNIAPLVFRYRLRSFTGITLSVFIISIGSLLVWTNDCRHNPANIHNITSANSNFIITLTQDPIEKTKSFKATATISLFRKEKHTHANGKIIVYFKKDSLSSSLQYGSQLIFRKPLQPVVSSGNPGGFDYQRYALFQGITRQVYLGPGDYVVTGSFSKNPFRELLNDSRDHILQVIRQYIPGNKEKGLAEALLIGYKDDLDKTLIQSYAATGAVHIIAISGLHLGIIYCLLRLCCRPLLKYQKLKWLHIILVISVLWLFTLLAGAQASVLRSAVMFTCIATGEGLSKKTNVLNSLALSAFLLLCINPFWLWDVGFQLSYAAVLGIVIFMKPIYNLVYFKNKGIALLWQTNAVTLAAQLLTLPVSLYHFHQFPNYFLLANAIAVPLSSIILVAEILLCTLAFIPLLAHAIGTLASGLIQWMNAYVERIERMPFAIWDGLQINIIQVILLYLCIITFNAWFRYKTAIGLKTGVLFIAGFLFFRSISFMAASKRRAIIVYNIQGKSAIDLIHGRHFLFSGDSSLSGKNPDSDFHLVPARTFYRISLKNNLPVAGNKNYMIINGKRIAIADKNFPYPDLSQKIHIDLLVISGKRLIQIQSLVRSFRILQVVFDGSVNLRNLDKMKRECDAIGIPWHDVGSKGAFVMSTM